MSNIETQETENLIERIKNSISNKTIKHYKYKDFNNIEPISKGAFSRVYSAKWKSTDKIFVLKTFNLEKHIVIKEILNEVNARRFIFTLCKKKKFFYII